MRTQGVILLVQGWNLSDTCMISCENKEKWMRHHLCDTILGQVCGIVSFARSGPWCQPMWADLVRLSVDCCTRSDDDDDDDDDDDKDEDIVTIAMMMLMMMMMMMTST